MNNDQQINEQIGTLADHLLSRRNSILKNWRHAVDEDPALTSASTLARKEFYDHIPAVLDAFDLERCHVVIQLVTQTSWITTCASISEIPDDR